MGCPTCNNGNELNKEIFPDTTIKYYSCGHKLILKVVNETLVVQEIISKDLEQLYKELGSTYLGGALYATKIDPLKKGKERFEEIKKQLFNFLCIENRLCEKIKTFQRLDVLTLFTMISSMLIGATFLNSFLPIGVISLIIVKNGVITFCKCN